MRVLVNKLTVSAYTIPTDQPEADGTLEWQSTTLVLVEVEGGGKTGLGYTYADASVAQLIDQTLKEVVKGSDVMQLPSMWQAMVRQVRNNGNSGLTHMGIAAVDIALWDLKAKVLDVSLAELLGTVRDSFAIYGSGGFTSYSLNQLRDQLGDWAEQGIGHVKMKIGQHPDLDVRRVRAAKQAIGDHCTLMVDANGAYSAKQALEMARQFATLGVDWFEEPVSSDDLAGLRFVREHAPPVVRVAAGEYGFNLTYFERMLEAEAVDVLQADATRCGGISGYLKAGTVCEAHHLPFSSHCAPALHLQPSLALPAFHIAEYFHDHVRIEEMLFDGVPKPVNGALHPDLSRPGLGLDFKHADAEKYKVG